MADVRILAPLAVLLGLLSLTSVAGASHIQCGDVISKNVKFDSNVECPNAGEVDAGLTIGASNITIDARGYQIVGPAGDPDGSIMRTNGAYSGVVLKNLAGAPGFLGGIGLRLSNSKVINNRAGASYSGVTITGNNNIVRGNGFYGGEEGGLSVFGDHNRVIDNGVAARFGSLRVEGSYLVVRRNTASADFDSFRIMVRDLAGQGIVTHNQAFTPRYVADALVIEGAKVNRHNEVVCINPDPFQCTPESQD